MKKFHLKVTLSSFSVLEYNNSFSYKISWVLRDSYFVQQHRLGIYLYDECRDLSIFDIYFWYLQHCLIFSPQQILLSLHLIRERLLLFVGWLNQLMRASLSCRCRTIISFGFWTFWDCFAWTFWLFWLILWTHFLITIVKTWVHYFSHFSFLFRDYYEIISYEISIFKSEAKISKLFLRGCQIKVVYI